MQKQVAFILFFLFLVSCMEAPILQELEQQDANEILVILSKYGIEAKKIAVEKQQQTTWTVSVPKRDEFRARELLVQNRIPRQKALGLLGVCKDVGMIPTPKMEKCRELLALKGEIINSLESVPGVVEADVVINVPDKPDFPDPDVPEPRPTASVVIQMGGQDIKATQEFTESKVQQFVANAVTGMDLRDVTVIITRDLGGEAKPNPENGVIQETGPPEGMVAIGGLDMALSSATKFKLLAAIFLGILVLLSGALIFILLQLNRSRSKPSLGIPALPEKATMNQIVDGDENK